MDFQEAVALEHARRYAQARAAYAALAEAGDRAAAVRVGRLLRDGRGGVRDEEQAAHWFERAAELGDPEGMRWLGLAYHTGVGRGQDLERAYFWFSKGAAGDDPEAMRYLGIMYFWGEFVERSPADAERLFERSMKLGNVNAARSLGNLHLAGNRMEEAARFLEIAMEGAAGGMEQWLRNNAADFARRLEASGGRHALRLAGKLHLSAYLQPDRAAALRCLRAAMAGGDPVAGAYVGALDASGAPPA